jgi:hypothetical protein
MPSVQISAAYAASWYDIFRYHQGGDFFFFNLLEYLFSIVSAAEIVGAAAEYANWNYGGNPNAYS